MSLDVTEKHAGDIISSSDFNKVVNAVKQNEEDIADKQDTLVSGTNIMTVNNTSLLGSGNIDIQGGGGDVSTITLAGNSDVTLQATDGDIEIATEGTYNASTNPIATKGAVDKKQNIMQYPSTSAVPNPTNNQIIQDANGAFWKYIENDITWDRIVVDDLNATELLYDNGFSGLSSTRVQGAIDELATDKQDTLVSGTNIKTINNTSILGSGNISISGGSSDADDISYDNTTSGLTSTNVQDAVDELASEKQDTQAAVSQSAPSAITLADNTVYYLSSVSSLTLTYPQDTHWECLIQLETASSGTIAVTFPNTTKYIGGVPTFDNDETWEISIRDGIVVAQKAVSASA